MLWSTSKWTEQESYTSKFSCWTRSVDRLVLSQMCYVHSSSHETRYAYIQYFWYTRTTSGKHQIGNELHPCARTTKNVCEPPSSVRSRYGTLRTADKPIVIFSPYAVPLQLFFSSFVNLAFPDRVLFFVSSRYCCRSRKEETTIFGVWVWVCLSTRRRQGQQSQISVVTT